ncbi:MAG: methionyl-tRNA formyltransferase [Bacillota bacterium]
MNALKLIFMGTPAFALPSLDLLANSAHRLAAVVTRPDKPVGRGGKARQSPVKQWVLQHGVEVVQPEKMNDEKFLAWLKEKAPDLIVTVAFGRILPAVILDLPPFGSINLHASYLPFYRGAAPIHRAIMEGAACSGVSIIKLTSELDAGDIIMQEKEAIGSDDTAGSLHDRLAKKGSFLLLQAINALAEGKARPRPQDHRQATYAPPLHPEEEKLNWKLSAFELYNRIRGLNPWPGAYTYFNGKRLKVWRATLPEENTLDTQVYLPGTILAVGEDYLTVAAGKGVLVLRELQPAGKKRMNAGSFCCGYRLEPGCRFDEEQQS